MKIIHPGTQDAFRQEEFRRGSREIEDRFKPLIKQAASRQEKKTLKAEMKREIDALKKKIFDRSDGSPYQV